MYTVLPSHTATALWMGAASEYAAGRIVSIVASGDELGSIFGKGADVEGTRGSDPCEPPLVHEASTDTSATKRSRRKASAHRDEEHGGSMAR
jgi:hypothetical protein